MEKLNELLNGIPYDLMRVYYAKRIGRYIKKAHKCPKNESRLFLKRVVKTVDLVYAMRKYDERIFLIYRALIQKTFGTSAFLFYVQYLDKDNFSSFSRHYFLNHLTVDDIYAEIDRNITGQNLQEY